MNDPFEDLNDTAAPSAGEQIDLSEFEAGGVAKQKDDNQDMGAADDAQRRAENLNEYVADTAKDDFDGMLDENSGFELDENAFPTNQGAEHKETSAKDEEEEDDFEEDDASDKVSLDQINKALGSNFKSLDEAKAFGSKKEEKEVAPVISKEVQATYEKNIDAIDYLQKTLSYDDDNIIRENERSLAISKNGGAALTEDQKDSIELKIERYKDNGTESIVAQGIRDRVRAAIASRSSFNEKVDEKKTQAEKQKVEENKMNLQAGLKDLYRKGTLAGIKLDPEDIKESYQELISGRFHKRLNNDHDFTARLALIAQIQDRLEKGAGKGSYSDGVKAVMSEVEGTSRSAENRKRTRQVRAENHSRNSHSTGDPLVDAFLK